MSRLKIIFINKPFIRPGRSILPFIIHWVSVNSVAWTFVLISKGSSQYVDLDHLSLGSWKKKLASTSSTFFQQLFQGGDSSLRPFWAFRALKLKDSNFLTDLKNWWTLKKGRILEQHRPEFDPKRWIISKRFWGQATQRLVVATTFDRNHLWNRVNNC